MYLTGSIEVNSEFDGQWRGVIPPRRLTPIELGRLDNLLGLYRRDQDQTHCFSTVDHASTVCLETNGVLEHVEHYVTDACIETDYVRVGDSLEPRPFEHILSFTDLMRPALESLAARSEARHCLTRASSWQALTSEVELWLCAGRLRRPGGGWRARGLGVSNASAIR